MAERAFKVAVVLCVVAALGLQLRAIVLQSLTDDEPLHLLAGHQALRYGQNTLNLEHPPLAKLLAAIPLALRAKAIAPPLGAADWSVLEPIAWHDPGTLQRARVEGRVILLATVAAPLVLCCFLLGRELFGSRTGVLLALSHALMFDVLPYLSIVHTDALVAVGLIMSLLGAIRYAKQGKLRDALLMGFGFGLGLAAKFSIVLVLPAVALGFAFSPRGTGVRWRALRHAAIGAALALAMLHIVYLAANWRYDRATGQETIRRFAGGEATLVVGDRMKPLLPVLLTIERFDPPLAQWLTGFLGVEIQNQMGINLNFAFGRLSPRGFWWYFPVLLLVKTPLVVLLASCGWAAAWFVGGRERVRPTTQVAPSKPAVALTIVTAAVYLAAAVASSYNIGIRHMLPVMPLLLLPAVAFAARRISSSVVFLVALAFEAIVVGPNWMAATNTWWLGARNPTRRAFASSNCDYRQSFLILAAQAERRDLKPLFVVHPIATAPEITASIPFAAVVTPESTLAPGWYAVSVMFEQFIPALERARPEEFTGRDLLLARARRWHQILLPLAAAEDHGIIAGTFHLYRVGDSPASRRD